MSGASGAGKSTTVAALVQRGCTLLGDDLTVVTRDPSGRVLALPGLSQIELCQDAAEALVESHKDLLRPAWTCSKSTVFVPPGDEVKPAPIRGVYILNSYDGEDVQVSPVNGVAKLAALKDFIIPSPLDQKAEANLFTLLATIAAGTPVYRLERPASRWSIDRVVDAILSH